MPTEFVAPVSPCLLLAYTAFRVTPLVAVLLRVCFLFVCLFVVWVAVCFALLQLGS